MEVTFIFEKSSSSNFTKVVNLCKKIGYFKIDCKIYSLKMNANDIFTKWDIFNSIFHLIKKWTSFELKIDDDSFFDYKSKSDFFYSIQDIKNCYKYYKQSSYKDEYCVRDFNCIWLKSISLSLSEFYSHKRWYSYGKWISDNIWKINKDTMKSIIAEESKVKHLNSCPCFELEKSMDIINNLPEEVNISIDKNWKIIYKNGIKDGIYQSFPYSIEFSEYKEPIMYTEQNEIKHEKIKTYGLLDELKQIDKYLLFGREISNEDPSELSDEYINRLIDEWIEKNKKQK